MRSRPSRSERLLRGVAASAFVLVALAPLAHAQTDDTATMPTDDAAPADVPALKPLYAPFTAEQLATSNYGLSTFIWGHPDTTFRDLDKLRMMDFGWQKSLFSWREMEGPGKHIYNFNESDRVLAASRAEGIKTLARMDFSPNWTRKGGTWRNARPDNVQDWVDFLQVFVDRYKTGSPHGHVDAIEVWNEPNLEREWGEPISAESAAHYVDLLKRSYATIKAIDPSIQVVTAGLSPTGWDDDTARPDDRFLQWMFDAGLSGNYDVLGVHGNGQAPDPTAAPGTIPGFDDASFYFRRIEQLRAIQEANGDAAKPMWMLEFGWTSDQVHPQYSWFSVSEDQKAQNIISGIQYARANWPWMGTMFLWNLPDPSWGPDREEQWWSIANADGSPRPALSALIDLAQTGQLP